MSGEIAFFESGNFTLVVYDDDIIEKGTYAVSEDEKSIEFTDEDGDTKSHIKNIKIDK